MPTYTVTLGHSIREFRTVTIEATDLGDAVATARKLDWDEISGAVVDTGDETDGLLYISRVDDEKTDILVPVDKSELPFSWAACDLVRQIAAIDDWQTTDDAVMHLHRLRLKARELCGIEPGGTDGADKWDLAAIRRRARAICGLSNL